MINSYKWHVNYQKDFWNAIVPSILFKTKHQLAPTYIFCVPKMAIILWKNLVENQISLITISRWSPYETRLWKVIKLMVTLNSSCDAACCNSSGHTSQHWLFSKPYTFSSQMEANITSITWMTSAFHKIEWGHFSANKFMTTMPNFFRIL